MVNYIPLSDMPPHLMQWNSKSLWFADGNISVYPRNSTVFKMFYVKDLYYGVPQVSPLRLDLVDVPYTTAVQEWDLPLSAEDDYSILQWRCQGLLVVGGQRCSAHQRGGPHQRCLVGHLPPEWRTSWYLLVTATQTSRQSLSILEWNFNCLTWIYKAIFAFIKITKLL